MEVPLESLNRWLNGERRPTRNLQTIARFLYGSHRETERIKLEGDFVAAWTFLKNSLDGKFDWTANPPTLAREFLIEAGLISKEDDPETPSDDISKIRRITIQRELDSYRLKLKADFESKPLFGQTNVSLNDLYIPPRISWENRDDWRQTHILCGELGQTLTDWLEQSGSSRLKLVAGGPGSGKTSFAKAFSAKLASNPSYYPILIPLHLIGNTLSDHDTNDLQSYLRTHTPLKTTTLEEVAGSSLVFIFDGLDELVPPEGHAMARVSREFAKSLDFILRGHAHAKAVVLGRTAMMQAFQMEIKSTYGDQVLQILGLCSIDKSIFSSRADLPIKFFEDKRSEWWKCYARSTGEPLDTPEIFKSNQFDPITNEPLLCYLIAISGVFRENSESIYKNEAIIYRNLIDSIWQGAWGDRDAIVQSRRRGIGSDLSLDSFNAILEAIAYSCWQSGSIKSASYQSLISSISFLGVQEAWPSFRKRIKADFVSLALIFYLRGAENERGIEFTHQTFAEFLIARLVVTRFRRMCRDWFEGNASLDDLLTNWVRLIGCARMSDKSISFLPMFTTDVPLERLDTEIAAGESLLNHIILTGLPIHNINFFDGEFMPRTTGNLIGEVQLCGQLAFLNCLSSLVIHRKYTGPLDLKWKDYQQPPRFLSKFFTDRFDKSAIGVKLVGISLEIESNRSLRQLISSSARALGEGIGPNLTGIFLAGADLSRTSFVAVRLTRATMSGCIINHADFSAVELQYADLTNSIIEESEFSSVKLKGADCRLMRAKNTKFVLVQASGVDFSGSNLVNCDFSGADLVDADFSNSTLTGTIFDGAKLDGANFMNALDVEI